MDPSAAELAAGESGYVETHIARAEDFVPRLEGRADLVVSHQVFEHVEDFASSVRNVERYLKPGGTFLCQFSGAWSIFAIAHRLIPARLRDVAVRVATGQDRKQFPAPYDRCHPRAFTPLFASWEDVRVIKTYNAHWYVHRIPVLAPSFRWFETRVLGRFDALASHYLVIATRPASPPVHEGALLEEVAGG